MGFMKGKKKKFGGQILTLYRYKFPSDYELSFIIEDTLTPNLPYYRSELH